MDTPLEIAKDKFIYDHEGECVTCKYYKMRRTIRNGQEYKLEWCENEKSDNYKQLVEDINECEDYDH